MWCYICIRKMLNVARAGYIHSNQIWEFNYLFSLSLQLSNGNPIYDKYYQQVCKYLPPKNSTSLNFDFGVVFVCFAPIVYHYVLSPLLLLDIVILR